jgi:6-phospho-3-hexuloisomerase
LVIRTTEEILARIKANARHIDAAAVEKLVAELRSAPAVFVHGAGRSGLIGRAFAMRLMHLGLAVYVVGEATTPAVKAGDLVLAVTGSGETPSVRVVVDEARKRGARVATITSNPKSTVARNSDLVVVIPSAEDRRGDTDYLARQVRGEHEPLTPMGTAFELTAMVLLDAIVVELMRRMNLTEAEMVAKHATLG